MSGEAAPPPTTTTEEPYTTTESFSDWRKNILFQSKNEVFWK